MKKLEQVNKYKELVKEILLEVINECDDFYDEIYTYDYFLKTLEEGNVENSYVLIEEKNNEKKILEVLSIEEFYGFTVVTPFFLFDTSTIALFLKKEHPDWIICGEFEDLSIYGYHQVSLISRLNPSYELNLTNHGTLWKYNLSTDIISSFEETLFPDISNLTFEWLYHSDFEKNNSINYDGLFQNTWNKDGFNVFYGFHYFKQEITSLDCHYLITKDSEGRFVGVIKVYDKDGHYTIGYIDVFYGVRNQGIAKKMIFELKKYLTKKQPIYLTGLSDCGKKCHIDEVFERILSDYDVFVL